jgi:glycosyltransferase involved in cell wall biosynthesis
MMLGGRHAGPARLLLLARPGTGGAARVIDAMLRRLPRRGVVGTAALSGHEGTALLEVAAAHGWETVRLDMEREIRPLRDARAGLRLRRLAAGHDFVHAHASKAGALARLALPLRKGVPVVYTPHGLYFTYHAPESPAWRRYLALERRLAPRTTLLHCVSRSEHDVALEHDLATDESSFVLPNPVPPRRGSLSVPGHEAPVPEGPPLVVMAARLAHPKDPLTFVHAAGHMDPGLGARFVLVGDGDLLEEVRREAGENTILLAPGTAVRELLARSRVAVLSSRSEALPLFLLEALTEGVPAVATDLPGCRDAAGEAALYVPLGDAPALARAVDRLLRDPELHADLVARARRRAPLFSEDRWLDGLMVMYEQVLHRPIRPA